MPPRLPRIHLSFLIASLLLATEHLPAADTSTPAAASLPTTPTAPFLALTHDVALARAKAENKPLLLFFDGHWSDDARKLSHVTFTDPRLAKTLHEKTVPLRIDVLRSPEITQRYRVTSVPQIVLVRADDTRVKRWFKYHSPGDLLDDLTDIFPRDSIATQRARLKSDDLHARLDLSSRCIAAGAYTDSLEELLWLYNTGIGDSRLEKRSKLRSLHINTIIDRLNALAQFFPPTRDALLALADREEKNTLRSPHRAIPPAKLAYILTALNDTPRLLAVYEKLPPGSKARERLKPYHDWETARLAALAFSQPPAMEIRFQSEVGLPDSIP